MKASEVRHLSDRDRMEATYGRRPERYHFADEQPEREERGHDDHRHITDGYCDHSHCHQWMPAD